MTALFGYGTFRRTAWRRAILGAEYPCEPATLAGYRRVATPKGYLSLRETLVALAPVPGVLLELDEAGWQVADAWEEVPAYQLIPVTVSTMAGAREARTYVYGPVAAGELSPVDDDCFATLTDRDVEISIAAFEPTMRDIRARYGG